MKSLSKCAPEASKFKSSRWTDKIWTRRVFALLVGFILASQSTQKEPLSPWKEASFFVVSNPEAPSIGDILKKSIKEAKKEIDIQIYALSDKELIQELNQKSKEIPISIYYDPNASKDLPSLMDPEVNLCAANTHALMHRKITLIDEDKVLVGSANYTPSSLYWHYNNLFGIQNKPLCDFLRLKQKGQFTFEQGTCFLLPDMRNKALNALIRKIESATRHIKLAMFSLSHPEILKALEKAAQKSVSIELYLDRLNLKKIDPNLLKVIKVAHHCFTQTSPVLLHHKLCLIDNEVLITGSANWTRSGFKRNEEVLFIFDHLPYKAIIQTQKLFERLRHELIQVTYEKLAPEALTLGKL